MKKTARLRQKLKLKHLRTKKRLSKKHPKVEKFFKEADIDPGKIREHSAKILGASAITGALLFSPPGGIKILPTPQEIISKLESDSPKVKLPSGPEALKGRRHELWIMSRVKIMLAIIAS